MTSPLDEKAIAQAHEAYAKTTGGLLDGNPMANAIRAYLSAVALPDELEVVAFDGVAKQKLDSLIERGWKISGYALYQDGDHGLITTGGFVGWFSVAERNDATARAKLETAEAEVKRLTEALENIDSLIPKPSLPLTHMIKAILDAALNSREKAE